MGKYLLLLLLLFCLSGCGALGYDSPNLAPQQQDNF